MLSFLIRFINGQLPKVKFKSTFRYNPLNFYLLLLTFFGFILRFYNLNKPKDYIFDEVYYVKNAASMLKYGVEYSNGSGEFVAHPPLGKWVIALGIKIFGDNPLGWRVAVLILGSASIYILGKVIFKLFSNIYLALLGSFLMAIDGIAIVQSRVAILEGILSFFVLISFYFYIDYQKKKRLSDLILFSIFIGAALAVKWSAIYYLLFYIIFIMSSNFQRDNFKTFYLLVKNIFKTLLISLASIFFALTTYLLSWSGWYFSSLGWGRWHIAKGGFYNAFKNLVYYHTQMLNFHINLHAKHNYQSKPIGWLLMARPTSFAYNESGRCGSSKCYYEILDLGNPLIWWGSILAIFSLILIVLINKRKNLSSALLVLGMIGAGYLPWFSYPKRTIFTFYTGIFAPYIYIALAFFILKIYYSSKNKYKFTLTLAWVLLITLTSAYFYALYAYLPLDYDLWNWHMIFNSWI